MHTNRLEPTSRTSVCQLISSCKRIAAVACLLLVSSTSRLALADIATGKYGKAQVFDVQRNPPTPSSGVPFTVSSFDNPYDHFIGPHTMNPGEYIQLVDVGSSSCSYAIDLFDASGVKIMRLQDGGDVYALDALGFLHISDVGAGTFVANSAGYAFGGSLTYTPTAGLVSCAALTAYVPNTSPIATPPAATIPSLSEWGMIIFAGTLGVLAFAAIRRSNSLAPG